ncbi:hypothetical protein HAX54_011601 [Datura stramonium]|uniref:CW-type domain-containing protein n=1 Tax=Datura stramonium TaxID=4076 RepID=A0ABS8TIC1_DATST|nr:hypothetical protein [Datura stramonium]
MRNFKAFCPIFQKDFEGLISAENLGPKFGVYGTSILSPVKSVQECNQVAENLGPKFGVYGTSLPTYQRFPSILFPIKSVQECNQVSIIRSLNWVGSDRMAWETTDSPMTIVHTITSFLVALLSPLHDNLLTLCRNKTLYHHQKNASYKADERVVSHKPYQPRMPHKEKQSFECKKKLTEHQPSSKELISGDEPPVSPFIVEENWIRCDKCHKWRLLPYGTKLEQLSESWLCSMLNWLPGMNHCDISKEDTTRALHALYQILILNNLQNSGGKGSIDVKAHYGREIYVKKRKLRVQDYLMTEQYNGDHLGDSDANAIERKASGGFRKQKRSKVFQTKKKESSTSKSKGEEKSRMRGTVTRITRGVKDSPPIDRRRRTIEREHQTKKYKLKLQSQAEFGMIPKQV